MAHEIVGRREELAALDTWLEALPGCGQALLFEGDAGIGKTALWDEGVRRADERGFRVLKARAGQSETQTAFTTIGDLFAPVLDVLPRLVPVQRRALEIALLIREPGGRPPDERLLGVALLALIREVAGDAPLVLAVDDAQWVDPTSAEVLRFMLRRLEADALGVLATVRGRPAEAPLDLDRAFSGFRRLAVGPLSVAAIHRLLWDRLGLNLPRPVLVRVHEAVGGNPFFALEVGRGLVAGTIRADSLRVALPERLRAVVAERLTVLPSRVRETLSAVAALAAPSVTLLEPLARTAVDDVELARGHGIVELDEDRIRFTHPLLAPVCYEDMPLHRRRGLHRRLADLDVDPEERARHLAIAADGPDEETAAALDAAATHAHGRGAFQVAAELAERAVALTPPDALARMNQRRIAAADHCRRAGDAKKATRLLERAARSSEPGPRRAEALFRLAGLSGVRGSPRTAQNLYLRALAEPGLAGRQKVNILDGLAYFAAFHGETERGMRYAEDALALAERLGEPELLVSSLALVATVESESTGRIRRDLLDRAIEIERTAGAIVPLTSPGETIAMLLGSGGFHAGRAMWETLIADAYERADPGVVWRLHVFARIQTTWGGWDEAARLCEEAMAIGRETGQEAIELMSRIVLAELDAYRGDAEKARRGGAELLRAAERANRHALAVRLRLALAVLELSCGDAEASWRHVAPLFAGVDALDQRPAWVAGSVGIEALIAVGDLREAERLLARLEPRAAYSDAPLRALADRSRGIFLAAQRDYEGAITALEAAAADPEPSRQANPFELARTLLALGTVQRKAQHKRDARESLERAVEMFERLGARIWLDNARSELRRIGGRIGSDSELSETERRIAELVAAGRRNREVAAELSLSPNTVAWNLSKVYRKLGVTSRTELAAHVAATPLA